MGRKRSVMVDTLGLLLRVVVHAAASSDLRGGMMVATLVAAMKHRSSTVWGDQHDGGEFADWA
jgi:putative transposase